MLDDQLKGNHLLLNLVCVSDIEIEIETERRWGGGKRKTEKKIKVEKE